MRATALSFTLILMGCVTDYTELTPLEISKKVNLVSDEFSNSKIYIGPNIYQNESAIGLKSYNIFMAKSVDKVSLVSMHILDAKFTYRSNGWINIRSATLTGGEHLMLSEGKKNVGSCSKYGCIYDENVVVIIPESLLKKSSQAKTDIRVKFWGDGGAYLINIPYNYVAGYLIGSNSNSSETRLETFKQDTYEHKNKSKQELINELAARKDLTYEEYTIEYNRINELK